MKFVAKVPGMTLYPGHGKHWWEHITPDEVVRTARRIEELGYDYITISEHIVMNKEHTPAMGSRWVHSMSAAGHICGATSTIKVMPLLVVPYHNAIELAKMISTVDYLSGGRCVPLMLLGYMKWEYDLLNVNFADRELIFNETLAGMIELWESADPKFDGKYVSFDDVVFDPKPAQSPMSMHFGGHSKAALRRIARWGNGWNTSSWTPRSELGWKLEYIFSQPEWQAKPRELDVSLGMFEGKRDLQTHKVLEQPQITFEVDKVLEQLEEIAGLGATYTDASELLGIGQFQNNEPGAPKPVTGVDEYLERLEWFAENIMAPARSIKTNPALRGV